MSADGLPPVASGRERHVLQRREELRFEVTFGGSASSTLSNASGTTTFVLQKGSCELYGCELAVGKTYAIAHGGIKAALFTWHGCVVDIGAADDHEGSGGVDFFAYTSDETDANVAFVNTHAQLEALRDDAAAANSRAKDADSSSGNDPPGGQGPRVMIVGPPECGKTTLAKILVAYACKVGRTPLMIDLDPMDNSLSVPGSLAVAPMHQCAVSIETYATTGLPVDANNASSSSNNNGNNSSNSGSNNNTSNISVHPLVMYHGSTEKLHPDLFKGQVDALAKSIERRLRADELARSSGIIVNTNGWIRDEGYECLLHTAKALKITVLLIVGHDRLYSMLTSHYKKQRAASGAEGGTNGGATTAPSPATKILKLPRSGGVVSRPGRFVSNCRSRAVKRYFYGDLVAADPTAMSADDPTDTDAGGGASGSEKKPYRLVHQLTPFAVQLPFAEATVYKVSSMALSTSLLPVNAQAQSTDAIQLVEVDIQNDPEAAKSLQHSLLAVCHPSAVLLYSETGIGRDLVTAGVAGFCAVDKVVTETDRLHLLSPCAGGLPSKTLLMGDITWME
eukprot:CAMPEP_0197192114 /NCGR_PEP_ID=MMETSP1423-20130617/24568_1 /TAXON_ID=476441 /ORGANISM="Pseudo-nitzschia heimii, Strain UNC1101" /LENGTH=564 /DNA_ID=CAMNT_0042644939 /DNA_START=161 /DNA_END=1855 /DNA_ORIENTATION=-